MLFPAGDRLRNCFPRDLDRSFSRLYYLSRPSLHLFISLSPSSLVLGRRLHSGSTYLRYSEDDNYLNAFGAHFGPSSSWAEQIRGRIADADAGWEVGAGTMEAASVVDLYHSALNLSLHFSAHPT